MVPIPGDVDLCGAGGGIDGGGGGEGAAARGDKLPVSIRQWSPYLVMLIFVEPAVELMVTVAVRGRRPGPLSRWATRPSRLPNTSRITYKIEGISKKNGRKVVTEKFKLYGTLPSPECTGY